MQRSHTIPESAEVANELSVRLTTATDDQPYPISWGMPEQSFGPDQWDWHGTHGEYTALMATAHQPRAHRKNEPCFCYLLFDQREIDGLVFMRRIAQQLITQEMTA